MLKLTTATLICLLGLSAALPRDPILRKLDPNVRYQYDLDSDGNAHLIDLWVKLSDLTGAMRYDPALENIYHLFTRLNPQVSQPLLLNNEFLVQNSNYSNDRRTVILIHGFRDNAISNFNAVLVSAFLQADDVNVIVLDWSGGSSGSYSSSVINTVPSGVVLSQFINWLNSVTGSTPDQYHIVGHGLGGHQAGIAARRVDGAIAYVTGLDPALAGWINHSDRFQPGDGEYTEVIHTDAGSNGYMGELAQVDFYPNGGQSMPGCETAQCDHQRSFFYFGESIITGGFTGRECSGALAAMLGSCNTLPGVLQMGGLEPKTGSLGVFFVPTNDFPPFSQD